MKQADIYIELLRKYSRTLRKLENLILKGKNPGKQDILQRRILRLFKTLTGLQRILKLGMAAAGLSAGMLLFQPTSAQAQTITFGAPVTNPFGLTGIGNNLRGPSPAFADLDADEDMDIMSGGYYGLFFYFQNIGTATAPVYAAFIANPFNTMDIGYNSTCAFADLDADGDLDMMSGEYDGYFKYFENAGTAQTPAFAAVINNPFGLGSMDYTPAPAFADLDGDGDVDIIAGGEHGGFLYFENAGTAAAPAFAFPKINPFGLTYVGSYSAPAFVDLDGDGDLDMLGTQTGSFFYFQNTGTATAPAFAPVQINPFNLAGSFGSSSPTFADLDGDGDTDLMTGGGEDDFAYFENNYICTGGITVFADSDGDGFGDASNSILAADCMVPAGYVENNTDCNDANSSIHPGSYEICYNNVDENCNNVLNEQCACDPPSPLITKKNNHNFS